MDLSITFERSVIFLTISSTVIVIVVVVLIEKDQHGIGNRKTETLKPESYYSRPGVQNLKQIEDDAKPGP